MTAMLNHDAIMLAYVKLAGVSQSRGQLGPRDKFLILAGVTACHAGWPLVANRCRELVLAHNPAHLLGGYETIAAALNDADFLTFLKQLSKFCPFEQAEHHLSQLEIHPGAPPAALGISHGEYALLLLGRRMKEG
jgi:hypothetical protein